MTNNREIAAMITFAPTTVTHRHPEGRSATMLPIHQDIHVAYRVESLAGEARAQRLADAQRRSHDDEHDHHPTLVHDHAAAGVRGALGRWLIGVGTVIAGDGAEAGARNAA
jgi:hypothetical protein